MTFQDILQGSLQQGFTASIPLGEICATMGVILLLAIYIFFIYRLAVRTAFYSKTFNVTVALMAVVTGAIVLAMQSNLVISLGMVGALSIVRFRNAVKEPVDLLFLFWSISVGIICGAGLYLLAVITSLVVTVAVFLLQLLPAPKAPMLLVVSAEDRNLEKALMPVVAKYASRPRVKSRNLTTDSLEMIIELRTKKGAELLDEASKLAGIRSITLMSHDGELRG